MTMSSKNVRRLIVVSFVVGGFVFGVYEHYSMSADWERLHPHKLVEPTGLTGFWINASPFIYPICGYLLGLFVSELFSSILSRREK